LATTNKKHYKDLAKKMSRSAISSSLQWYSNRIRLATGQVIQKGKYYSTVEDIAKGGVFQYTYDPKWKDTLPYYDMFPLVVPIEMKRNGWLGINLHYYPPELRAALFDDIVQASNKKKGSSRLMIAYSWIEAYKNFDLIQHGLKRYLFLHVTSPVVRIEEPEWDFIIPLPSQQFRKKSAEYVWNAIP
jgi:hypothetical protein